MRRAGRACPTAIGVGTPGGRGRPATRGDSGTARDRNRYGRLVRGGADRADWMLFAERSNELNSTSPESGWPSGCLIRVGPTVDVRAAAGSRRPASRKTGTICSDRRALQFRVDGNLSPGDLLGGQPGAALGQSTKAASAVRGSTCEEDGDRVFSKGGGWGPLCEAAFSVEAGRTISPGSAAGHHSPPFVRKTSGKSR